MADSKPTDPICSVCQNETSWWVVNGKGKWGGISFNAIENQGKPKNEWVCIYCLNKKDKENETSN